MKTISLIVTITCLFFLTGCGPSIQFVYPEKISTLFVADTKPVIDKTIAVLPFDDYRDNENSCYFLLHLIPYWPLGWGNYNRPEAAPMFLSIGRFKITPSEDLAKATALSLRHSNIFYNAFFTLGGDTHEADYVLSGRIKMFKYKGKVFSYGVTFYAPIFWVLGAPAGTSENRFIIELQLKNHKKEILWEWSVEKEEWIFQWIYARMWKDCNMFAKLYQEAMNEAMANLAKKVRENPNLFK